MAGAIPIAKTTGKAAQYALTGTNNSATITPYDSGTILGTVPPGKAGLKLVSGVIQNATALTVSAAAADAPGNAIVAGQDANGQVTESSYQAPSAGLSLAANHE